MNKVGDIKKGTEIGYKDSVKRIWIACSTCGKKRWVKLIGGKPSSNRELEIKWKLKVKDYK